MIHVDEALTRKVAELARLELSADELTRFTAQLRDVLGHIDQLASLNLGESVEPMTHPLEVALPLRADQAEPFPRDGNGKPKVLEHAPEVLHDGYKVPQIL